MSVKPTILRLGDVRYAQEAWKRLSKVANIVTIDQSMTREKFLKALNDPNDAISSAQIITRTFQTVKQTGRFDKELCENLPKSVVAVCHLGAGYDQIDTQFFKDRKIQVTNVPELVNDATADTHVFLLLGALRNFSYGNRVLINGEWPKAGPAGGAPVGNDPEGKVVGVLGMGGIGRTVVKRLQPFGFSKFIYHNRNRLSADLENGCDYVSFEELLEKSDIISVNIPLNPKTKHILNEDAFSKMKDGVVIVNTARGAVIDETAMIKALKSGKIRAAGLDVFEEEPQVPKELLDMPQVIGLPHMGTNSFETMKHMEEFIVENVENVIKTGRGISIVPELKGESWIDESKPLA